MLILKYVLFLLAGLVVILVLAFWGFKQNFPGKSIAGVVQASLTNQTGIPFEIQDIELGWNKISTPEIVLRTPEWLTAIPDIRLLILEKLEVPFTSIITSGKANVHGLVHDGAFRISTELLTQKVIDLSINGLQIERAPLFSLIPYIFVSGFTFTLSAYRKLSRTAATKSKVSRGNN